MGVYYNQKGRKENMSKNKQFVLTCKESKEYRDTGKTVHNYGGIGYVIENVENKPTVTSLIPASDCEYEIIVRR